MPRDKYCQACREDKSEEFKYGRTNNMRRFYLRGGGAKGTSYKPGGWICPELHVELDHGVEIPRWVGWTPSENRSA